MRLKVKRGQDGPSGYSKELSQLLEQVIETHDRVRESIKTRLIGCQEAILGLRTAQRAHRAYYRARKKGRERSGRLL